jgi:hypothetical protein
LNITAFNGDLGNFRARAVGSVMPEKDLVITSEDEATETLLYLLGGEAEITVAGNGSPQSYTLEKGSRLFVPQGMKYFAEVAGGSILVECSAQREETSDSYQRINMPEDFAAAQVKFAQMHKEAVLGGHLHPDYREYFSMLKGEADFTLADEVPSEVIEAAREFPDFLQIRLSPQDWPEYHVDADQGLLVNSKVPHKGVVSNGGLLVGCTEKMYVSADVNDMRCGF